MKRIYNEQMLNFKWFALNFIFGGNKSVRTCIMIRNCFSGEQCGPCSHMISLQLLAGMGEGV